MSYDKTYNVLRIWCKGDLSSFWTLFPNDFGDDMSIRDGSHTGKPIIFRFASVDLCTVFFYGSLRSFQFGAKERYMRKCSFGSLFLSKLTYKNQ